MNHKSHRQRMPWLCLILAAFTLAAGCASRYRMNLILSVEHQKLKMGVESTEYMANAALADPYAEQKVTSGGRAVVTVLGTARGREVEEVFKDVFSFDEYLRCRLYVEIALPPQPDSITLVGHSFALLLGRYDWPPRSKVFLPESGHCVVDSVTRKGLFATIHGKYKNDQGLPLDFEGQFKVKVSP